MKICYLADAGSIHTQRWVSECNKNGIEVIVISFRAGEINNVPVYTIKIPISSKISPNVPFWRKVFYIFGKSDVEKIIKNFNPDIVHSFWASSYGFLGSRLKCKKFLVSVWGQDITKFPKNNFINRLQNIGWV